MRPRKDNVTTGLCAVCGSPVLLNSVQRCRFRQGTLTQVYCRGQNGEKVSACLRVGLSQFGSRKVAQAVEAPRPAAVPAQRATPIVVRIMAEVWTALPLYPGHGAVYAQEHQL